MKTKILFAAVAVAFSFVVTSCGNKKAAEANTANADSCCAKQNKYVILLRLVARLKVIVQNVKILVRKHVIKKSVTKHVTRNKCRFTL